MRLVRPQLLLSKRWREEAVFLIGGGPSATEQIEKIKGRGLCVAINDCFRHCPWADAVFTIDDHWLSRRAIELSAWQNSIIAALPVGMAPPAIAGKIEIVERREGYAPILNPHICYYGENSGFGALYTALANGAGKSYPIYLVGFDMGAAGHWHRGYEWRCRFGVRDYPRWREKFKILAREAKTRGADIVNLNPQSAIRCFRFGVIDHERVVDLAG